MTYLDLVKKVCHKCGYQEPSNFNSLGSEQERVKQDVADAWQEIQVLDYDWDFLDVDCTLNILPNKREYTITELNIPLIRHFYYDSILTDASSDVVGHVITINHDSLRASWLADQQTKQPSYLSLHNGIVSFDTIPDQAYTLNGKCRTRPVPLVNEGDAPACFDEHHHVIAHLATMKNGIYDNNPEGYQEAQANFNQYIRRMRLDHGKFPYV